MGWVAILQTYWPSILAALALGATWLPKGWTSRVRLFIAGLKLPDLNGPDTLTDSAKNMLSVEARIDAEIAEHRAAIERLETDKRNAKALVVHGGQT